MRQFFRRFQRPGPASVAPRPTPAPLMMALEPRVMFDASVVAVASDAAAADGLADAPPPAEVQAPVASPRQDVVFVDAQVQDAAQLIAGLPPGTEVVRIDAGSNGFEQMAAYLAGRSGIDSIALLSHGDEAAVQAGTSWLTTDSLGQHTAALQAIGGALSAEGDLLLYGCRTGAGTEGLAFVNELARITGADVAASTDDTGTLRLGGDWQLERQTGAITSPLLEAAANRLAAYDALLAAPPDENYDDDLGAVFENTSTFTLDGLRYTIVGQGPYDSVVTDYADIELGNGSYDAYLQFDRYFSGGITSVRVEAVDGGPFHLAGFSLQGFADGNITVTTDMGGWRSFSGADFVAHQNVDTAGASGFQGIRSFTFAGSNLFLNIDDIDLQDASLPPVVGGLSNDAAAYVEGSGPVLLDVGSNATLTDADSADFNGGSVLVSIWGNSDATEDVLGIRHEGTGAGQIGLSGVGVTYGGVSIGYVTGGTGGTDLTIALNGNANAAAVQALLRNLTYANTNATDPHTPTRFIDVRVNDGDGGTSATATTRVSVTAVNDAPLLSASGNSVTYTENGTAVDLFAGVGLSTAEPGQDIDQWSLMVGNVRNGAQEILRIDGTDVLLSDGNSVTTAGNGMTVTVSLADGTASVVIGKAGGVSAATAQGLIDAMTYRHAGDSPDVGTRTVTLTSVRDTGGTASGGVNSTSLNVVAQVAVVSVNDAPIVTTTGGANTFVEAADATASPVVIDAALTLSDIDHGTLTSATVAITGNFAAGQDVLAFANGGGGAVGNIVGSYNAATGVLTLSSASASATLAQWQSALRSVTYLNTSDTPTTSSRSITFTANDGNGSSAPASKLLNVTSTNDAPVHTVPASQIVRQDGAISFGSGGGNVISVSDADAGNGALRMTVTASNGLLSLSGTSGLTFLVGDGSNDQTLTVEGRLADINAALDGLVFSPTPGFYGSAALQITTSDLGRSGAGGAQTDTDTVLITVARAEPVVTGVGLANPDGTYKAGDVITLTVDFDQAVFVDTSGGAPSLRLETGAIDRQATYAGGSGTGTLHFTYTVQAGDLSADLDYLSSAALALNGATLRSGTALDAVLTLPVPGTAGSVGAGHDVAIDGVAPVITAVGLPPDGTYVAGQGLQFTLGFGEVVIVDTAGGTPRVAVTLDTGGTAWAEYVAGSGSTTLTFRMPVDRGQVDSTGITLGGHIDLNGGTVHDATGNAAIVSLGAVGPTAGVRVDAVDPQIISVAGPAEGHYKAGDVLTYTVRTDEPVNVDLAGGAPRLTINLGGRTVFADFRAGAGSTELQFQYTVQAGDTDADGPQVLALATGGAVLVDAAGNPLALALPASAPDAGRVVDTTAPVVSMIERTDGSPTSNASARYTVRFSEDVSGLDATDFRLVVQGDAQGRIVSVSALDARTFVVTVGELGGSGEVALQFTGTGSGVTDAAGNAVTGFASGDAYHVEPPPPAVPPPAPLPAAQPATPWGGAAPSEAPWHLPYTFDAPPPIGLSGTPTLDAALAAPSMGALAFGGAVVPLTLDALARPGPGDPGTPASRSLVEAGGVSGRALEPLPESGTYVVSAGEPVRIVLPASAFSHNERGEQLSIEVRLADGRPLPKWLRFDPLTGTLSGLAPGGMTGKLEIEVIARDGKGNRTSAQFEIEVKASAAEAAPEAPDRATPRPDQTGGLPSPAAPAGPVEGRPSLTAQFERHGAPARQAELAALQRHLRAAARPSA